MMQQGRKNEFATYIEQNYTGRVNEDMVYAYGNYI